MMLLQAGFSLHLFLTIRYDNKLDLKFRAEFVKSRREIKYLISNEHQMYERFMSNQIV